MDLIINRPSLRLLIILGVPFLLGLLELGHPAIFPKDSTVTILSPVVNWWLALHLLQMPLFGLLGCAVYLLARNLQSIQAVASRVTIWFFIVFYPAFDAAVGLTSGLLIKQANNGLALSLDNLEKQLDYLFWGPLNLLWLIGSLGWLVSLILLAISLAKAGASRLPVILFALAGVLLGITHMFPIGTLANICFFLAALQLERERRNPMRFYRPEIKSS